jgi:hypothetical protein
VPQPPASGTPAVPAAPASPTSTALVEQGAPPAPEAPPLATRQDLTVALLPLALVAFTIIVIVAAAWTFLTATGA